MHTRALSACDLTFTIHCADAETAALVDVAFGGLLVRSGGSNTRPTTSYRIERNDAGRGFRVCDPLGSTTRHDDADGLLFHLDKCLTLALQQHRPELYFLHAAAVAIGHRVAVLAAPPGTGKSTLTLALLESGAAYLSDELAPIDIGRSLVYPFAHAVCLKSRPPEPWGLPLGTVAIGRRFHVAAALFPAAAPDEPVPLGAFVFLRRSSNSTSGARPISAAAGVAHLLANTLNALAHQNDGLTVAVSLARRLPCFELDTSDLGAACAEVDKILKSHPG